MSEFLHAAAKTGDIEAVRRNLLDVAVDVPDSSSLTALMHASFHGHTEVVRVLLDWGASIDLTTNNGKTALMYASMWGRIDVVKMLLGKGANLDLVNTSGRTAQMEASEKGQKDVVALLQEHADTGHADGTEQTASSVNRRTSNVLSRSVLRAC